MLLAAEGSKTECEWCPRDLDHCGGAKTTPPVRLDGRL